MWEMKSMTLNILILLICLRVFQYNFINQINDTSIDITRPHWIRTFSGVKVTTLISLYLLY